MRRLGPWQVEPDTVLPAQFRGKPAMSREKWLMLAVLDDALEIYRQHVPDDPRHRRLVAETERWLFSDDTRWPFSFVNVCDLLGIDVDWLRMQLRRPDRTGARAEAPGRRLSFAS